MNDETASAISKSLEKIADELERLNDKLDDVVSYSTGRHGYISTFDESR